MEGKLFAWGGVLALFPPPPTQCHLRIKKKKAQCQLATHQGRERGPPPLSSGSRFGAGNSNPEFHLDYRMLCAVAQAPAPSGAVVNLLFGKCVEDGTSPHTLAFSLCKVGTADGQA